MTVDHKFTLYSLIGDFFLGWSVRGTQRDIYSHSDIFADILNSSKCNFHLFHLKAW